jgi:hypothetical protein
LKKLLIISLLALQAAGLNAQTTKDSVAITAGDDPSQFFTRAEFFNEIQYHNNNGTDFYLNQTTMRAIVKIGNRFTTRLDVPFVYNSLATDQDAQQFGLGDISLRLLGYKINQTKRSATTASMEISLNTASSPLLGTGKNMLIPMLTYSRALNRRGLLMAIVFQEVISFSGDENRDDVSFSKIQPILIYPWTRKMWTVLAPELYIDYIHGGASMNLEGRLAYAPARRMNVWLQVGGGLFGDFAPRYVWGSELGCRYFLFRMRQ